jgi:hypothetical protein
MLSWMVAVEEGPRLGWGSLLQMTSAQCYGRRGDRRVTDGLAIEDESQRSFTPARKRLR